MPAVDIVSGELTVFTNDPELFKSTGAGWTCISGDDLDVASCACASASYPLVIAPTTYRGHVYMDGGCRMNLPTPLFDRSSVDAVVGVGMIRQLEPLNDLKPLAIAQRTMSCGANQLDRLHAQAADIYVNLPVSGADAFQAGTGQQVTDEARGDAPRQSRADWSPRVPAPSRPCDAPPPTPSPAWSAAGRARSRTSSRTPSAATHCTGKERECRHQATLPQ